MVAAKTDRISSAERAALVAENRRGARGVERIDGFQASVGAWCPAPARQRVADGVGRPELVSKNRATTGVGEGVVDQGACTGRRVRRYGSPIVAPGRRRAAEG
jgi:hypothetical protein